MTLRAASSSGQIAGSYTSTQVIANLPPAACAGKTVLTEMGLMACDGVRWNVTGTPPIPPGAAMFGYGKNLYTCFPVLADIGNWNGSANTNGAFRLYNGYAPYGYQPNSTAYQQDPVTKQLQLLYQGNGNAGNGLLTLWPYATAKIYANYGFYPSFQAGRGFHFEYATTMSANPTDMFNAGFLMPQEHNNQQDDSNPAFASEWEQWPEFDINESGLGTNLSGGYRGAYLQWAGRYAWAQTFSSAPSGTITSFPPLSTAWEGESGPFTITLSTAQQVTGNFTNGSTAVTCTSTTITGTPTATFTTSYKTWLSNSNYDTTACDYTTEHIVAGTYDPVGQTYTSWLDGAMTGQVSTYNAASANTYRDSLHCGAIFQMASHGSPYTPTKMNLRYFAAWVP